MVTENTESQHLESDLQQDEALESLGIVVGTIGHDFNNILSLIIGYVEMALSEIPEGHRARSDLEHVLAAGDRAKDLVSRILTFRKNTKLKRKELEIAEPVVSAIENLKKKIPASVKLTTSIDRGTLGTIESNETEIYQIVQNLIFNSLQSLEDYSGEIDLTLDYVDSSSEYVIQHPALTRSNYARISVRDSGCGMSLDTIEKMYTPFFTTARGSDHSKDQAGLGLTTVYNVVASLDGAIFVDSEIDKGTLFEICVPVLDPHVSPQEEDSTTVPSTGGSKHILFVDDETPIIEMGTQMLEISGYQVTSFTNGDEALQCFREQPHKFDLVITDLTMPTISGTELALSLSAINPNIPIILATGFSEKITTATCQKWNINTVINKPYSMNELLTTISEYCD